MSGVYNAADRSIRVTRDRHRLLNAQAEPLAYFGRSHPLVQRAIAAVWRTEGLDDPDAPDTRVSAARHEHGDTPALLLTFRMDLRTARREELQRVIAVLLPSHQPAIELADARDWLAFAAPDRTIPPAGMWKRLFHSWVPARQADVEAVARSAMTRHCGDFTAGHQERSAREAADLERWLLRRTEEICGPSRPATLDLFDADRNADDWRTLTEPLDRLAAFAADAGNPPPRRQAANETFRQFHHRAADRADRSILLPPTVRPLGMLMLIPARLDG